jgi:hypothetical protein
MKFKFAVQMFIKFQFTPNLQLKLNSLSLYLTFELLSSFNFLNLRRKSNIPVLRQKFKHLQLPTNRKLTKFSVELLKLQQTFHFTSLLLQKPVETEKVEFDSLKSQPSSIRNENFDS